MKIIMVLLRRPVKGKKNEMRSDPFWEFGSFGCTRCHHHNLMNPNRIEEIAGARLAFAQGGPSGVRMVALTPPVKVHHHDGFCEVRWAPHAKPFRYGSAPLIVDNKGRSDFPLLRNSFRGGNRSTREGEFSSCFRSRRTPLRKSIARAVARKFDKLRQGAARSALARTYVDALPFDPPTVDQHRRKTYNALLSGGDGKPTSCRTARSCCGQRPAAKPIRTCR